MAAVSTRTTYSRLLTFDCLRILTGSLIIVRVGLHDANEDVEKADAASNTPLRRLPIVRAERRGPISCSIGH